MTGIASAKLVPEARRYRFASRGCAFRPKWVPFFRLSMAVLTIALQLPSLPAQEARPSEYAVEATYLFNFARFVEWPSGATASGRDSFAICVLGPDPFGQSLDATLAGESVGGKPVVAKRISRAEDSADCRILFISPSEATRLKEILTTVNRSGVLTVSDMPQFAKRGGMIQFVLDGNRVRFEVNLTNARDAGLTLSSELLKVAVAVRKNA